MRSLLAQASLTLFLVICLRPSLGISGGPAPFQLEQDKRYQFTPTRQIPVIDKSKVDPQLLKAAQGMEAMFLDYMMQSMRRTVPRDGGDFSLDSPASDIYRGMLDSDRAQKIAQGRGVGLSDQIIAYLMAQRYNYKRQVQASTGGTHEGQSVRK